MIKISKAGHKDEMPASAVPTAPPQSMIALCRWKRSNPIEAQKGDMMEWRNQVAVVTGDHAEPADHQRFWHDISTSRSEGVYS